MTTQQPIGRPYLTVVIDVRTRCVLAALVSLAPFCGGTLLKTMAIAVVASPGRPRGIMSKLIIINGSDYQDSGFVSFCTPRSTSPSNLARQERPTGKPSSNDFRTISEDLIHKLPGTTFSNPTARGDYSSQTFARLTLEDLDQHVQTWIDEVYHRRPPSRPRSCPARGLERRGCAMSVVIRTLSPQDAEMLARTIVERGRFKWAR